LDDLRNCRVLVDFGGGLGTYAKAWVESDSNRRATIVDLPAVGPFVADLLAEYSNRIEFVGADLNHDMPTIPEADLLLFANVLHLIPAWPALLSRIIERIKYAPLIAIFEADADTPSGQLFDLQVHLRSGRMSGLLPQASIRDVLGGLPLQHLKYIVTA